MTDQRPAPTRRPRSVSAGVPATAPVMADERIAELEARLARLEASSGLRERGRDLMGRVVPPESSRHFRNAGREHLLGIRSIVDFWIRRIELAEERTDRSGPIRERIEVE
jgi:hypothetical protein